MFLQDAKVHFDTVIGHAEAKKQELQAQIAQLQREMRELETTISGVHRLGGFTPAPILKYPSPRITKEIPDSQKYANVSMRWAILLALNSKTSPVSIQELSDDLKTGGLVTNAVNVNNAVSSVLSRMKSDKEEVDVVDSKWKITEIGSSAIAYIMAQKLRRKVSAQTETPSAGTLGVSQRQEEAK